MQEDYREMGKKKSNPEMLYYLVDLLGTSYFLEVCISQVLLFFFCNKVKKNQIPKSHQHTYFTIWKINLVKGKIIIYMILKMFCLNAGEDVEKREPSYTVGGDVN